MRYNHFELLPEKAFQKKVFGKGLSSLEGGGGGSNTVEKSAEPWGGIQPTISNYLSYADSLAKQPYQGYTGQLYAPTNDTQSQAIDMAKQTANSGSPQVLNTANTQAGNIINGSQFSGSPGLSMSNPYAGMANPYTDQMVQAAQNDTIRGYQTATAPSLDAQANMAGAYGGSGWQQATANNQKMLGETLAGQSSALRNQDLTNQQQLAESGLNRAQSAYSQASNNQVQTLAQAPNLAQTQYGIQQGNLGNLYNAGSIEQQNQQNMLNQQQNMLAAQQAWNQRPLDIYGQAIGVAQGTPSINSTESGSVNPYATAIGLGNIGLGAYKASLFGNNVSPAAVAAATAATSAGSTALSGAGAWAGMNALEAAPVMMA